MKSQADGLTYARHLLPQVLHKLPFPLSFFPLKPLMPSDASKLVCPSLGLAAKKFLEILFRVSIIRLSLAVTFMQIDRRGGWYSQNVFTGVEDTGL